MQLVRATTTRLVCQSVALVVLLVCALISGTLAVVDAQSTRNVTAEMVEEWMTELSNWGRWGPDDQLGTLNLVTPEKRRQAVALALTGTSVSMSHN